jgi:hypothetical protein
MAIGTAAAIGIGISAVSTAASFAQQSKQNKLASQARSEAEAAVKEAKKRLDVNYSDQLSINKEPYRMASEAINSSVAQAIEAAKESERGVAATAGRVAMASNQAQMDIANQMGQEMQKLDILSAQEDAANRNQQVGINLAEAKGSNIEAQNREQAAAAAGENAWMGVADTGLQVAKALPLYAQSAATRKDYKYGVGDTGTSVKKLANQYNIFKNDPYALLEPPMGI